MLGRLLPRRGVLCLLLLVHVFLLNVARSAETTGDALGENGTLSNALQPHGDDEEEEAAYALLFAPFTLAVGVVVFFVLSRYMKALPYTAVMFLIGTLMGITSVLSGQTTHLQKTLDLWISIVSIIC
jgi:FtsH-binding integral membrane protein